MNKNKYLLASGCSYTGGGAFNNLELFGKEFPTYYNTLLDNTIPFKHDEYEIFFSDTNFKNLVREYLWPDILSNLLQYNGAYNVAAGGKGIHTTINNLYHFIFNWMKSGKDVTELEIWYQIPSVHRIEIYINKEDNHQCILTELNDGNEIKEFFITNFFDEDYNLLSGLHEMYKFKKYCDALGVTIYFIPWDSDEYKPTSPAFISLKKRIESYKKDIQKNQFKKFWSNIDEVLHYNIDDILIELNPIFVDDITLNEYARRECNTFYFKDKYSDITNDSHMTKDGHQKYAETLKEILK